tara:strand:- start:1571 stop:2278 length:708 start_codon:yes stop_codon:yes gene_type:complete
MKKLNGTIKIALLLGVLFLLYFAYTVNSRNKSVLNTSISQVEKTRLINSYTIIKEDRNRVLKKVNISIQLKQEVSLTELKEIALIIKEERKSFKNLFIFHYLPGHKTDSGAWASTHFSPDLEVKILGTTKEDWIEMDKVKVTGEIKNIWLDNNPMAPNKIYLVRENQKLYMKTIYPKSSLTDGSEIIEEIVEKKKGNVTRYDFKNTHGEYYIIEKNGNLGMYDLDGKFKEAVKEK